MRPRKQVDEGQLRAVEILELIDEDVLVAPLDAAAVLRCRQHIGDGQVDLVVERLAPAERLDLGVAGMDGAERHRGDGGIAGREDRHGDALGILQGGAHAIERREEVADRIGAARGLEGGQAEARGLHGL